MEESIFTTNNNNKNKAIQKLKLQLQLDKDVQIKLDKMQKFNHIWNNIHIISFLLLHP